MIIAILLLLLVTPWAHAELLMYLPYDTSMVEAIHNEAPAQVSGNTIPDPDVPAPVVRTIDGLASGGAEGGALDLIAAAQSMGGYGGWVRYGTPGSTDTALEVALNDLQSFTIMGWFNTANAALHPGGLARFFNRNGGVAVLVKSDGQLQVGIEGAWINADTSAWDYADTWVFWAVSYDGTQTQNNIKFYVGTLGDSVTTLAATKSLDKGTITGGNQTPIVIANNYYSETGAVRTFKGYIDELRFFGSKTDASGVLSLAEINSYMLDVFAPSIPTGCALGYLSHSPADFNSDCAVDCADLADLAADWLTTSRADLSGAYEDFRSYSIYEPTVTKVFVADTATSPLQYNHDTSIEYYRGKFYFGWNANTNKYEGRDGQLNYLSTSTDGMTWSDPISFTPSGTDVQWQPNFFNYNNDEALWCMWTERGGKLWFSTLTDPAGPWTHRLLTGPLTIGAKIYQPFATQEPVQLASGRVCFPLTFSETGLDFYTSEKLCGHIYTDGDGTYWSFDQSSLVTNPLNPVNIWESMLVQQYDGQVRLFARNLDKTAPQDQTYLTAVGDSNGLNFPTQCAFSSIRTVSSRMWVQTIGSRRLMLQHDSAIGDFVDDRINIALFTSRSGMDDFAAGVPILDDEPAVAYPQACAHDGKLYVSYSQGNVPRSAKCAIVDPLPADDEYYVFPRSAHRALTDNDPCVIEARVEHLVLDDVDALRFYGNAAAGLDIDIVDPDADTLSLVIPIYVSSAPVGNMLKFLSVGDGQILLGYDATMPDRYRICIDGVWADAGPFFAGQWNTIKIVVNKNGVVTYNRGMAVTHGAASAFSARVYLGDGYPDAFLDMSCCYYIDVARLGSRVDATEPAGVCGDASHFYPDTDVNLDCMIDVWDYADLAADWIAGD